VSTFLPLNLLALLSHEPIRLLGEAHTGTDGRPVATTTVVEVQHG
jgi:hypothetical protein